MGTPGKASGVAISGNTAYVADGYEGLQIIDTTDPRSPAVIASVDSPETIYGVQDWYTGNSAEYIDDVDLSGNKAYLTAGTNGVLIVDIADPTTPTIIGSMDPLGPAHCATVSGNTAYVSNGYTIVIIPLPIEMTPININSDSSLTGTLPGPALEGNYNLQVFNQRESHEMLGAVTFFTSTNFKPRSQMKAIIVAGGGDYAGNTLWPSTRLVANQAYKTLVSQGYTKENIYYLGPHSMDLYPDDGIANDIDAAATSTNLSWAINPWAADASELFVYMTDHGKAETFQLNADEAYFQASKLDNWLDSLQVSMSGRVVCVYDACNSGSFIPLLTPPAGKQRIVIASSQADERAWFMNQGINSFSYQFWSSAWLKGNLYDAFVDARDMVALDQTALLDADGDGIAGTKADQTAARTILIGRGRSAASLPPSIMAVSDDQILDGPTQATLWAELETDALDTIDAVWAVVVPPDHGDVASDIPVTNLPSVDLLDTDGDGIFEGQYDGYTQNGTYRVIVYAKDKDDLYSLPASFYVHQQAEPVLDSDDDGDGYTQDQGDCDDSDDSIHPGAPETCSDSIDQDCDGIDLACSSSIDGGYALTNQLWARAVLEVPGSPVTLIWKMVGADITPSGDQVISGYFYADPDDFVYGSVYNPELFVKVYIAANGWANIAFNHVTVDGVTTYSAYNYTGSSTHTSNATRASRLVEHTYTGVAIDTSLQSSGESPAVSGNAGYTVSNGLWARAWLTTGTGPVNLIWKGVGTDTTPSGDRVISGYFYASPAEFAYGSVYNPEMFVKVYIAKNGWANMAFNHVTLDGVEIMSSLNFSGLADQSGTATLEGRLVEHQYTGVGIQ